MVAAACSDQEFMALFDKYGPTKTALKIGTTESNVYKRRRRLETKYDRPIATPSKDYSMMENTARLHIEVTDNGPNGSLETRWKIDAKATAAARRKFKFTPDED